MPIKKINKHTKDEIIYEVERHYVGNITPIQAILPVIMNDIKMKREKCLKEKGNKS